MARSRFCRPFKEFSKTAKCQVSSHAMCGIHLSQASLFLESRNLVHRGSLCQRVSFTSQIEQHVTPFRTCFTKLSKDPACKTKSYQSYLTRRGVSSGHHDTNSRQLKKDTLIQSTDTVSQLSHVDAEGHVQMVDVGTKEDTIRVAVANAVVYLGPKAFFLVKGNKIAKGDVLTVAQLAGIMACKQTASLIPLCHNIQITHSEVKLELDDEKFAVCITGTVNSVGKTGVEMESLTAVSIAALTVYDMCKAVSRDIMISEVKLVHKTGGKSGDYNHS